MQELILATDMSRHTEHLTTLAAMLACGRCHSSCLRPLQPGGGRQPCDHNSELSPGHDYPAALPLPPRTANVAVTSAPQQAEAARRRAASLSHCDNDAARRLGAASNQTQYTGRAAAVRVDLELQPEAHYKLETPAKRPGQEAAVRVDFKLELQPEADSELELRLLMKLLIKLADISNVLKPFPVCMQWMVQHSKFIMIMHEFSS